MRTGVYPGSFDPITYGHIDIVQRSLVFFDRVIIAVAADPRKNLLFSTEQRVGVIRKIFEGTASVQVEDFAGLLVDYMKERGVRTVIRGLRALSDFDYEFQMTLTNRKMNPEMDTMFLMPSEEYFYVSSSMVKEIRSLGGDVTKFVHPLVDEMLAAGFPRRQRPAAPAREG